MCYLLRWYTGVTPPLLVASKELNTALLAITKSKVPSESEVAGDVRDLTYSVRLGLEAYLTEHGVDFPFAAAAAEYAE